MASTYQQNHAVELELMGQETILLNTITSKFCLLNRSAAVIWNALKQPRTLDSVVSEVCSSFQGVAQLDASKDTQSMLEQLHADGFVLNGVDHSKDVTMQIETGNPSVPAATLMERPPYEPPKVKFMDEQEAFATLQVSVNAMSWWGGM